MSKYVWTHHAVSRQKSRKIPDDFITKTLQHPQGKSRSKGGGEELQRQFGKYTVSLIVKVNDRGETIVISCWMNPPMPGTKDHKMRQLYFAKSKSRGWKRIWLELRYAIGI